MPIWHKTFYENVIGCFKGVLKFFFTGLKKINKQSFFFFFFERNNNNNLKIGPCMEYYIIGSEIIVAT